MGDTRVTIQIPVGGDEQDREIASTYGIAIAKGWELAARIWARCEPQQGRGKGSDKSTSHNLGEVRISFTALAAKSGRSGQNISVHWNNWQDAIDKGWAVPVKPGDTVTLPTEDYPPTAHSHGIADKVAKNAPVAKKLEVIQELTTDPEVARAVEDAFIDQILTTESNAAKRVENAIIQKAGQDPQLFSRVNQVHEEFHPRPTPPVEEPNILTARWAFGARVYGKIQRETPNLPTLLTYLESALTRGDSVADEIIADNLDDLEKAEALIRQCADKIRSVKEAATFARLMGQG